MRCWQSGLGLASQSWAVPAQCQVQRCCEPLSLLPGSSLDHGLWSRVPLHTSPGCHERRVKKGVPKGVTSCPETSMGHREPHSPAQELPFCRCLEKEGEALPGADPCLLPPPCIALPVPIPACPSAPAETTSGTVSCCASPSSTDLSAPPPSVQQQAAWGGFR